MSNTIDLLDEMLIVLTMIDTIRNEIEENEFSEEILDKKIKKIETYQKTLEDIKENFDKKIEEKLKNLGE